MRLISLFMFIFVDAWAEVPSGLYSRCDGETVNGLSESYETTVILTDDGRYIFTKVSVIGNKDCITTDLSAKELMVLESKIDQRGDKYELVHKKLVLMPLNEHESERFNQKKKCGFSDWRVDHPKSCPFDMTPEPIKIYKTKIGIKLETSGGKRRDYKTETRRTKEFVDLINALLVDGRL